MNYIVQGEDIREWPSDTPPESFKGVFLPGVSDPPPFDPSTEALEKAGLQVETDGEGNQTQVRQLWMVRALSASELESLQVDAEMALAQEAIDTLVAHRDVLNNSPTNAQVLAAVRSMVTVEIRVLRYLKRQISGA